MFDLSGKDNHLNSFNHVPSKLYLQENLKAILGTKESQHLPVRLKTPPAAFRSNLPNNTKMTAARLHVLNSNLPIAIR